MIKLKQTIQTTHAKILDFLKTSSETAEPFDVEFIIEVQQQPDTINITTEYYSEPENSAQLDELNVEMVIDKNEDQVDQEQFLVELEDQSKTADQEIETKINQNPPLTRHEEEEQLEEVMRTMDLLNCHECHEQMNSLKELFSHIRDTHQNSRPFIFCCDRKNFGRARAFDHMRVHLDKDAFKCPQCENRYPAKFLLNCHIKQVHTPPEDREFVCEVCAKSFAKRSGFEDHVKYHTAPQDRPYKCTYCGNGFTTPYQLKRHVARLHEKTNNFICEDCGKGYGTNSLLSAHRHKNHQHREKDIDPLRKGCKYVHCESCGKRVSELNFEAHTANNCFEGDQQMECTICRRKLKTAKSLKAHLRLVHPNRESGLSCPYCTFLPVTAGNRIRHIKHAHPGEEVARGIKCSLEDDSGEVQESIVMIIQE